MNDIPQDLVLVAERLSRALVADGDAIERDFRRRVVASPLQFVSGENPYGGPSIDVAIDALDGAPRRHARGRRLVAIAAVIVVSLALVAVVSRRDSATVATGSEDVRYFLPVVLPEGYALTGANLGFGNRTAPSSFESWRRIYTQRGSGKIGRVLMIDSQTPSTTVDPPTDGQTVVVAGRSMRTSITDRGIFAWFTDDFGCGYVTIAAIGYETATAPPSDLLDQLSSIECAPTPAGGRAAAIAVPSGFALEDDYDAINQRTPGWSVTYTGASNRLSPLGFFFGETPPSPDLTVMVAGGSATRSKRNGREYWTAAPLPVTSDRGAYVAWNEGPYLVTLSSVELGLDDLLAVADSVHEVDKATFDAAIRLVQAPATTTTTR